MSFVSLHFMLFLPIVFILYWFVFKPLRWQNLLVLVASYVFYGWWDWRFLCLIALTSACSYASGILIKHYDGRRGRQKAVSAANIILNIGILAVFKYFNFFVESLENLLGVFGSVVDWPTAKIILPVGISFYTFQALSYSIDVYKGKVEPTRDPIAFFAFISFFPQLVAGPIERASNLLPQFLRPRSFDYASAVDGCRQMLWGFFKKLVIADRCAAIVNPIWANYNDYSALNLVVAMILFSFQVYCDFSGYSDIAIGCARLFGIDLMRNFKYPYFARNIPEFWRRWHISLMSWFRDYVYFPLGGSRCPKWRTVFNNIAVFVISGLWHGADWTFVCYGCYHGLLCSSYVIRGKKSKFPNEIAEGRMLPSIKEVGMMLGTFMLVTLGRILFRARNLGEAGGFISHLCSWSIFDISGVTGASVLALCAALILVEWVQRDKAHPLMFSNQGIFKRRGLRWAVYYALVLLVIFAQAPTQDFIYFQF